jgi:hypothetical protein
MAFSDLPTLADMAASRRGQAQPKGIPTPLVKAEKKKTKAQQEKDFRRAVWTRDKGRSRASGKPLAKSGSDYTKVGEVHHLLKRSTHPEDRLNPSNGILLSKDEHVRAETVCPNDPAHCLLDIVGPTDRSQPQVFIWRDIHGTEVRRRIG